MHMDINLLRGLVTIAALAAFLGIVWWAYGPARKARFERDALLPFLEEEGSSAASVHGDFRGPSSVPALPSGEGNRTAGNGLSAIPRMNERVRS
jgi:cytochrome c oxidase cbb3-type subunit 4